MGFLVLVGPGEISSLRRKISMFVAGEEEGVVLAVVVVVGLVRPTSPPLFWRP